MVTAKRQEYLRRYRDANRDRLAAEDRARYAVNKPNAQAIQKAYRSANKEKIAAMKIAYATANKEAVRAANRAYYEANKAAITAKRQEYRDKNGPKIGAYNRRRKLAQRQRTPAWLTAEDHWLITQAYELAAQRSKLFGFSWHVDHILPLHGRRVSGLHVPTNLQVIPGKENCQKSNGDGKLDSQ
jgi:hypothetical protein